MVSCDLFRLDQGKVEAPGLTLKVAQLAVAAFGLELFDAFLHIRLAAREHGVDETGELVRGGLDGTGRIQAAQARAVAGADEAVVVACGAGGQAQGLPGPVEALRRAALQCLAAADAGGGRQRQPRTEVLGAGKARQVGTDFRGDRQRGFHPDGGDGGQVHAQHRLQCQAQAPLAGSVGCNTCLVALWRSLASSFRPRAPGADQQGNGYFHARLQLELR